MNLAWSMRELVLRVGAAFLVSLTLAMAYPRVWMAVVAPMTQRLALLGTEWLEELTVRAEPGAFFLEGTIQLNLQQEQGGLIPPVPGHWRKGSTQTLAIFIVAVSAWAAPRSCLQRRLLMLPMVLLLAALLSALDLILDLQASALASIGSGTLQELPLAKSPENWAQFRAYEQHYRALEWIKAFQEAGGRLFLAALGGLAGYAIRWPAVSRRGRARPRRTLGLLSKVPIIGKKPRAGFQ